MSYVADEDMYRCIEKHNNIMVFHSFIAMEYAFKLFFFAANSSINAAGDHLAGGSFTEKELN